MCVCVCMCVLAFFEFMVKNLYNLLDISWLRFKQVINSFYLSD